MSCINVPAAPAVPSPPSPSWGEGFATCHQINDTKRGFPPGQLSIIQSLNSGKRALPENSLKRESVWQELWRGHKWTVDKIDHDQGSTYCWILEREKERGKRNWSIGMAKLQFSGTTSWYFDQKVDKTINNWHKYQQLIEISNLTKISKVDKNVNSWQKC